MSCRVAFRLVALALAACAASALHAGAASRPAVKKALVMVDQPVACEAALADFIQTH